MSVAEVHALEAEVWEAAPSEEPPEARDGFVKQELAAALAADPNDLDALVLQARRAPRDQQASLARALVQKAPADPRGWTLLADALEGPAHDERLHAVERALATGPADPEALVAAARFAASPQERVRWAEKAVALIPSNVDAVAVLARDQAENGQCDEARTSADRAVDLVGESAPAAERRRIADWLQKSIAACHRP
jgi:hypothetical protein